MSTNNKPSINQQDHPHRERQTMNTPSQQRGSENNSRGMDDMMNESEEQKAGRSHGQKEDSDVRQDERQP